MGLNMFLYAKKYLYVLKNWPGQEEQYEKLANNPLLIDLKESGIKPQFYSITVEAGYWRKANHIHQWFVTNVQDGNDDCKNYHVNRECLTKLKETCQTVLMVPSLGQKLLPIQEGFFFGGTEYDDYYVANLHQTIEIIDQCLKYPDAWEFEYYSSW